MRRLTHRRLTLSPFVHRGLPAAPLFAEAVHAATSADESPLTTAGDFGAGLPPGGGRRGTGCPGGSRGPRVCCGSLWDAWCSEWLLVAPGLAGRVVPSARADRPAHWLLLAVIAALARHTRRLA